MQGLVKKWGNSAAVRIPASVLDAAHIGLEQLVDVRAEDGRIVIDPVRPVRYNIDTLVAGITEENRHDPVETGPARGLEVW